ncbi:MAG: lamin tail domain-containing protein [Sumerlaeia bacterium]
MRTDLITILTAGACALALPAAALTFRINEVDSDTADSPSDDVEEFVEIWTDEPFIPLDGLVVVFFDGGTGLSYRSMGLSGAVTDAGGRYVIGTSVAAPGSVVTWPPRTMQNGEDAVALYWGTEQAFPNGTAATPFGLLDVVVYATDGPGTGEANTDWLAFGVDDPPIVLEGGEDTRQILSAARVPEGTGRLVPSGPTPGTGNDLPTSTPLLSTGVTAVDFGNFNQSTDGSPATQDVEIRNAGNAPLEITGVGFGPGTDPEFFDATDPALSLPQTLNPGQSITFTIGFSNGDTSADRQFTGSLDIQTAATKALESLPITASFVIVVDPAVPGQVVVNEVGYDPSPMGGALADTTDFNQDGVPNPSAEDFVELHNLTNREIDLKGWELSVERGGDTETFVLGAGTVLTPRGVVVFFPEGGNLSFLSEGVAFEVPGLALSDEGATITVGDGATVSDTLSYGDAETRKANAGASSDGGSIGRVPDGLGAFEEFQPGAASPAFAPSPGALNAPAQLAGANGWEDYF